MVIGTEKLILDIMVCIFIIVHITLLWYYVSVPKEVRIKKSMYGLVFALFSIIVLACLNFVIFSELNYPFGLLLYLGVAIWSILFFIDFNRKRHQMDD